MINLLYIFFYLASFAFNFFLLHEESIELKEIFEFWFFMDLLVLGVIYSKKHVFKKSLSVSLCFCEFATLSFCKLHKLWENSISRINLWNLIKIYIRLVFDTNWCWFIFGVNISEQVTLLWVIFFAISPISQINARVFVKFREK